MLSAFAPKKIVANYTHVHIEGIYEQMQGIVVLVQPARPMILKKYQNF